MDGVISFWELSQPLVARLAEQLGLPGNPPDAVDNARDKQASTPANCNITILIPYGGLGRGLSATQLLVAGT